MDVRVHVSLSMSVSLINRFVNFNLLVVIRRIIQSQAVVLRS